MELNVSLISNKAPNLHFAISSEINTALITNKKLLLKERGNYKFIFSLKTITFHCKKKLQIIINPTCAILCLLSYWENTNTHSNL